MFKEEKMILQLTFNPGLTLTGFRTTWPWVLESSSFVLHKYQAGLVRGENLNVQRGSAILVLLCNCQYTCKMFLATLTRRFVSVKRLFRGLYNS